MRICKSCNVPKELEFFSIKKKKSGSFSYQTICKSCRADQSRLARKENPDRVREMERKARANRSDEQKFRTRLYLSQWRLSNKEKTLSYKNPTKIKKESKKYYEKYSERIKQSVSKYRKQNPEKVRALAHSRRGLERTGKLSSNIIDTLMKKQKGLCVCCRLSLGSDFHLDHILPLFLGGTNTDDNVQLLRSRCNLQKNAKHPIDYMQEKGYLL